MEILRFEHENVRILASRELHKFGIKLKLKKLPSRKVTPKKRCYGVALHDLETVDVAIGADLVPVPKVFHDLVCYIEPNLFDEGIFRKEGSKVKERTLLRILDNGSQIPENTSVIEACSVLKILLRKIPGYLVPHDLMPWFLTAEKLSANSEEALTLCVLLLPLENLYLLVFLFQFFYDITTQAASNKMTSYNMAVVLAPNVFPYLKANEQTHSQITSLTSITKTLIEQARILGIVPPAILNRVEELHEEHNTKKRCCAWYVDLRYRLARIFGGGLISLYFQETYILRFTFS